MVNRLGLDRAFPRETFPVSARQHLLASELRVLVTGTC